MTAQEKSKTLKDESIKKENSGEGRMVDVGGHRLFYRTNGEGSPTVIIEPGTGASSEIYGLLEKGISRFTRVVSYDRAGLGQSETGPVPTDGPGVAKQLHALLQKANIPGPYILLGHSFGGIYIRHFTARFPDKVVGLVFVDSSHPEQNKRLPAGMRISTNLLFKVLGAPGIGTPLVKSIYKSMNKNLQSLPPEQLAQFHTYLDSPKHMKAVAGEYKMIDTALAQTTSLRPVGDKPIVVFSATLPEGSFLKKWHILQGEIAALSTNSSHYKIEGARHFTLISEPGFVKLIVESVQKMVEDFREKTNSK